MSAAISGTLHQHASSQNVTSTPSVNSHAMASTAGASGESSSITANDFLTLLVTEMKNQDPTANTNPNEYINQLVQVNSLQQLISINQTLNSGFSAGGGVVREESAHQVDGVQNPATHTAVPTSASSLERPTPARSMLKSVVEGNLAVPQANPAAVRVANALNLSPPHR